MISQNLRNHIKTSFGASARELEELLNFVSEAVDHSKPEPKPIEVEKVNEPAVVTDKVPPVVVIPAVVDGPVDPE